MVMDKLNEPQWTWLALAGCCYCMFLFGAVVKCIGILYVEYLDLFDRGPVLTSLVQITFLIGKTATTVFSGYIADHFTVRWCLFSLCLASSSSYLIAAFALNLELLIFTNGIMLGCVMGLITTPVVTTVTRIFNRHRSLSNGILFGCSSLGTLTTPILYSQLINMYTVRGTLMVMAALWLNVVAVALFLSPEKVKWAEMVANPVKLNIVNNDVNETAEEETNKNEASYDFTHVNFAYTICKDEHPEKDVNDKTNNGLVEDVNMTPNKYNTIDKVPGSSEHSSNQEGMVEITLQNNNISYPCVKIKPKCDGNIATVALTQGNVQATKDYNPDANVKISKINKLRSFGLSYIHICKQKGFLLYMVILTCAYTAFLSALLIVPAYATDVGLSKEVSSLVFSLLGATELCSRVIFGYIGDLKCTNKTLVMGVAQTTVGLVLIVISLISGSKLAFVCVVTVGFLGGIQMVYQGPIFAKVIGLPRTGTGTAIVFGLGSLMSALMQIPIGMIKEQTGSFTSSFLLVSGFYLAAGILSLSSVLVKQIKNCQQKVYDINP